MRTIPVLAAATCTALFCGVLSALAVTPTTSENNPAGQPRIVGGIESKQGDYPWMVYVDLPVPNWKASCGGTLISKDIVLTAQHCMIFTKRFIVRHGHVWWSKATPIETTKMVPGRGLHRGDWAVLKLDTPVDLPNYPILPSSEQWNETPIQRTMGWGLLKANDRQGTAELREVDLPLVKHGIADCTFPGEICMGDLDKGGIDSCQGDSGGPLVARHNNTWVQTGVVSWGEGCGEPKKPGHYTKISDFASEIRSAIDKLGGTQPTWAPTLPDPVPSSTPSPTLPPVPDPVPSPAPPH